MSRGWMENDIDIEDLIEEEQSVFTMTANGYIKRTSASEYAAQGKSPSSRMITRRPLLRRFFSAAAFSRFTVPRRGAARA